MSSSPSCPKMPPPRTESQTDRATIRSCADAVDPQRMGFADRSPWLLLYTRLCLLLCSNTAHSGLDIFPKRCGFGRARTCDQVSSIRLDSRRLCLSLLEGRLPAAEVRAKKV